MIKHTEVCRPVNHVPIHIPWCIGMVEAKQLCEKYRGKLSVITSSEHQRELFSLVEELKYDSNCGVRIWTGFTDESSEGHYTDIYELRPLEPTLGLFPFAPSQPNGRTKENCAIAYKDAQKFDVSWYDYDCEDPNGSSFCEIDSAAFVKIRGELTNFLHKDLFEIGHTYLIHLGLPAELPFDKEYTVTLRAMKNGDFSFNGYSNSRITYDKITNGWRIEILSEQKKYATTNGTLPPLGTREYQISENLGGGGVTLSLHACDEEAEFNCNDGGCIPIQERCDSRLDCGDGSDESQCHIIEVPNTYLRHVPAGVKFMILQYALFKPI